MTATNQVTDRVSAEPGHNFCDVLRADVEDLWQATLQHPFLAGETERSEHLRLFRRAGASRERPFQVGVRGRSEAHFLCRRPSRE